VGVKLTIDTKSASPGRVNLVIGPSGSGKSSLIRHQREEHGVFWATDPHLSWCVEQTLKIPGQRAELLDLARAAAPALSGEAPIRAKDARPVEVLICDTWMPLATAGTGLARVVRLFVDLRVGRPTFYTIDPVEEGLCAGHEVALKVWQMIAEASEQHGTQVWAATYSWEVLKDACRVFAERKDDGLRVITCAHLPEGHHNPAAPGFYALVHAPEVVRASVERDHPL
jgi:hypothetical protein